MLSKNHLLEHEIIYRWLIQSKLYLRWLESEGELNPNVSQVKLKPSPHEHHMHTWAGIWQETTPEQVARLSLSFSPSGRRRLYKHARDICTCRPIAAKLDWVIVPPVMRANNGIVHLWKWNEVWACVCVYKRWTSPNLLWFILMDDFADQGSRKRLSPMGLSYRSYTEALDRAKGRLS